MTMIDVDYTEVERWDGDPSDDRQYCIHGTFIGSWWGPDYLCGYCESGVTRAEFKEIQRQARLRPLREGEKCITNLHTYVNQQGASRLLTWSEVVGVSLMLAEHYSRYVDQAVIDEYLDAIDG